jgi:hypothetical protein
MTVGVRTIGLAGLIREARAADEQQIAADLAGVMSRAAEIVVAHARSTAPDRQTRRASTAVVASRSATRGVVRLDPSKVPWVIASEFGHSTRRNLPARDPSGRYVYPAITAKRAQVAGEVESELLRILTPKLESPRD